MLCFGFVDERRENFIENVFCNVVLSINRGIEKTGILQDIQRSRSTRLMKDKSLNQAFQLISFIKGFHNSVLLFLLNKEFSNLNSVRCGIQNKSINKNDTGSLEEISNHNHFLTFIRNIKNSLN